MRQQMEIKASTKSYLKLAVVELWPSREQLMAVEVRN